MKFAGRKPDTIRYTNAAHVGFHTDSLKIHRKYASLIDAAALMNLYAAAVARESGLFTRMRQGEYTEKKVEVDRQRVGLYRGIGRIVRDGLQHFDPAVRAAAARLNILMKNYGDVPRTSYSAETAAFDSLVARLRSEEYAEDARRLGIGEWVEQLDERNALFKTYVDKTAREALGKSGITFRAARHETDRALHRLVARVEALVNLNGAEPYAALLGEYGALVKKYNTTVHEHYGRLHARIDIAPAVIAPIPPQPFTGRHVFVIPGVSLHSTAPDGTESAVELVFEQDFTVTYKNNLNPGTATLVIQGAGQYRGKIITTFNIDRD